MSNDVLPEIRARRLLARPLVYIDSAEFHGVTASWHRRALADMPGRDDYEAQRRLTKAPKGAMPHLHGLFLWPLLTKAQEQHLFRKMNYLKFLEEGLRQKMVLGDYSVVTRAEEYNTRWHETAKFLANCNMRLVLKVAQKFTRFCSDTEFDELISDGNASLVHAVERFSYSFGFKFSTYAYWAIKKNYGHSIEPQRRRRQMFPTGHQEDIDHAPAPEDYATEIAESHEAACRLVDQVVTYLEPKERAVVRLRRGLGPEGQKHTLAEVGMELGLTKERVRQINETANAKMKTIAHTLRPDPAEVA